MKYRTRGKGGFKLTLLRLANITKKYKLENGKERVVLDNISLSFSSNGFVSIIGKSGSGKAYKGRTAFLHRGRRRDYQGARYH